METKNKLRRRAVIARERCAACGACVKECPREAVTVWNGCFAVVNEERCVGCGRCEKVCPTGCIAIENGGNGQ